MPTLWVVLMGLAASFVSAAETIPTQAWSRDVNAGGYLDGAPIGGFGAGTITWRFDGQFYKTRLNIGAGNDNGSAFTADANSSFYYYCKPASGSVTYSKLNATTLGSGQATYYSLYPKSWVSYSGSRFPVKTQVTQFSPLIPGDYQRVSYPVGVYKWEFTNSSAVTQDVAVMLTWQNNDFSGASAAASLSGNDVMLTLQRNGTAAPTAKNQGEYTIASTGSSTVTVTYGSAAALSTLESDFQADGALNNTVGAQTLGALAIKTTLAPGATATVPIVLSWDIPIAQPNGYKWYRQYTRYFGNTGLNSRAIAEEALSSYASWESSLDSWQSGILTNTAYPTWLKSMLFNELYIYFTAGTMWTAGPASGQAYQNASESLFSHLESYIYPFYGTSDVRFYGSWALFLNWPDIDKQAVRQFCDSVWNNRNDRPAALGTCAHDIGDTNNGNNNDPNGVFAAWNAYIYRDSTKWKDLNSKLVLMVYRDWLLTGKSDTTFLNYCWQPVTIAMAKTKSEDTDGDGLPNSTGIDQTYDDMDLTGNTAYCGGLFLASCQAAKQLALAVGNTTLATQYQNWFDAGQASYESELWTGTYYKIDTGSTVNTRIMSDQLCGEWYSKALGLGGIVSDSHAVTAFQTIYNNNFLKFDGGANGVVNVMTAAGSIDTSTSQTQEAWAGPAWGLASGLVQLGLTAPASAIGQSLYNTIWTNKQFWFRTPEAWTTGVNNVRAYYYMRASAVWAVKQAVDAMTPPSCGTFTCTPTRTGTATGTPTPTGTPTLTPTVNPCASARYRVNCGGPTTVSCGNSWSADQAWAANGWGYVAGTAATITNATTGTCAALCLSERYGATQEYRFTLPNGAYQVNLKFVEQYYTSANSRIFSVALNGNTVVTDLDVYAEKGRYAEDDKGPFTVTVTNGALTVLGTASKDNAEIAAIEIIDMNTTCTPNVTYTPTRTGTPTLSPTVTLSPTITPTLTPTGTPTSTVTVNPCASAIRRVNCGGPATIINGVTWTADQAWAANGWGYMNGTAATIAGPVTGTNAGLCLSERYATPLEYRFTLNNGTYGVNLKFVEQALNAVGARVFSVSLNGTTVISNLDIYKEKGKFTEDDKGPFYVTVTGGALTIIGTATTDNAEIVGIEIIDMSTTCTPAMTATFTPTWTPTPTLTLTPTMTRTQTPTATVTATLTRTATVTQTSTSTETSTLTGTWTATATATHTPTGTTILTTTSTSSPTGTSTASTTSTQTATWSPTRTSTATATLSPMMTGTSTATSTGTQPPTNSPTATGTVTSTYSLTSTLTWSSTPTQTVTPNLTSTWTATRTATSTATGTASSTPTFTLSSTRTSTGTSTATSTLTQPLTNSPTLTGTITSTWTATATLTATETASRTSTSSNTPTVTASATSSMTPTSTWTGTLPPTGTWTVTGTPTNTATTTYTFTPTYTVTATPSSTWTSSSTPTATSSMTKTSMPVFTHTPTATSTLTWTPPFTATPSFTATLTSSNTPTSTYTRTFTWTETPTWTATPTASWSSTPTATASVTSTETVSVTMTSILSVGPIPVVYPNPVGEGDTIRVAFNPGETTGKVRVTVVSVAYRKVLEQTFLLDGRTGVVDLTLDSSLWHSANGMYYLVLHYPSGKTAVAKFVVLR
jgi:non-lysosomal glucosylceramidase